MSKNFMDKNDDSADFFENLRKQVTDESRNINFEPPKPANKGVGIWLGVLIGSLVAVIVGYGIFGSFINENDESNAPVIEKDVADIKVRPDSPGGMEIPDQDKLVYDRIAGDSDGKEEVVERIMPRAQRPTAEIDPSPISPSPRKSSIKMVDTEALPQPTTIEDLMKTVDDESMNKRSDKPASNFSDFSKMDVAEAEAEQKRMDDIDELLKKREQKEPNKQTSINEALSINKPEKIELPKKEDITNQDSEQKLVATVEPVKEIEKVKTLEPKIVKEENTATTNARKLKKSITTAPAPVEKTTRATEKKVASIPKSNIKSVTQPSALNKLIDKTASPEAKAADLSGWSVQLLASKSKSAVEKSWKTISKKHSVLSGVPHNIVRADLGAKGVYYRLRAGSYNTKGGASNLCSALKSNKQDCMVVKN
jgi:hypothetical protein